MFGMYRSFDISVQQAYSAASKDRDSKHKWKVMEYRTPDESTDYANGISPDKCLFWVYKDGRTSEKKSA